MPTRARAPYVASAELKARALRIHDLLCREYGCPVPYFHQLDPLSELVSSMLSHRTRNADSGRAFKELRRRLPEWSAVRAAATAEVQDAIAAVTWPEVKAPTIQRALRLITERRGELSLDFLADLSVPDGARVAARTPRCRLQDQRGGAVLQRLAQGGAAGR